MSSIKLYRLGKETKTIVFPSTKRGDSSTVVYEVKNITNHYLAFTGAKFDDPDCSVINLPKGLEPGDKMEFMARFSPSTDRPNPLNTSIQFEMDMG